VDHPTGTGVYNPFLTVQNSPWEQGYNSSTGNFDTKREPQWNREIKFSDLQTTTINGIAYFGFSVDINEPNGGNQATISLDALRIYTSSSLQSSTSTDANGFFNGSLDTLRYDLGANQVIYNDQNTGSGAATLTSTSRSRPSVTPMQTTTFTCISAGVTRTPARVGSKKPL
jgi:hypothetical protein